MDTYYIDGMFVDDETAAVSVKDIIVLRGYGVFDFMITYNRRPFRLKQHVQRLQNSANEIGLKLRHSAAQICAIVEETVQKNNHHEESNVRIVYSGGVSSDGVTPEGNGILMVLVTPRHELPRWWYTEGAKIITVDMERYMPLAKSTNYLSAVYALEQARKQDAIESIYVDRDGRVLEGTTSSIFFFKNGTLITPDDNILPGVTRSVVLDLVKGEFEVELRDIKGSELDTMDEVFLTASNKEVVPVVKVNGLTIGDGRPGRKTQVVMQRFRVMVSHVKKQCKNEAASDRGIRIHRL
jgi:branched-chain amino acid aminotransferase